ncbi:hypothetical protein, partial [Intrasporangium sp.]|uniref:hypothetical protein n=1 Tax=Intrasporangium sp. TaxID=1925024 RepID=UPI003F81F906
MDERPRTEIALPSAETGAFTGAATCVPDPTLRVPDVAVSEPPVLELVSLGAGLLEAFVVDERPNTDTALPSADTGAL